MTKAQTKRKTRQFVDQNPIEAFRDIAGGVAGSVKKDLVDKSLESFWQQFSGQKTEQPQAHLSGDLTPGMGIDIRETVRAVDQVEPGLDYHRAVRTAEVRITRENEGELQQKIAQIQFELKKLVQSSRELQVIFKEVTVETAPVKPGKYHLHFLEWLLSVIRQARLKVDESRSWLATAHQKRSKQKYWAMFKKHGTTFGLSSERVVSTQTG